MLVETHAHLDYSEYDTDRDAVITRALEAGVSRIITIGTRVDSSRAAVALAEKYDCIYAVVGVHPTEAHEAEEGWLDSIRELALHPKVVAIGEIGLDYHHLPSSHVTPVARDMAAATGSQDEEEMEALIGDGAIKNIQAAIFQAQLDLAVELGKNVVIHQRDSWEDTLKILAPFQGRVRGVFHCFGGTPEEVELLADLGHLVSFTGILTFKNASQVREAAQAAPLGGFMVETDCPYLAPVPHRGARCEPAHTRLVAEKLAEVRGVSFEAIAEETTRTALSFFKGLA